jgi:Hydroxymethylpyrimidine/phosphomethylpyrimidine kinase
LHALGAANVVVTGGHLDKATDLLSFTTARGAETEVFKADRQRSKSTHGTGCAFSTALACHLAQGGVCPRQFYCPRHTSRRLSRMPTLLATETVRCTIFTEWGSSVGQVPLFRKPNMPMLVIEQWAWGSVGEGGLQPEL